MSSMSVFNLPTTGRDFIDLQLGLYCVPLLGDILRIAMVVNTFKTLSLVSELSPDDVKSTRIDIAKWVIGMIPAAIIGAICPITGIISVIVGLAAIFSTLAEQTSILTHKTLEGRVTSPSF